MIAIPLQIAKIIAMIIGIITALHELGLRIERGQSIRIKWKKEEANNFMASITIILMIIIFLSSA